MPIIRIDDGQDPRLGDYAGVRAPALLKERGLLIAEGRFVVRRLLDSRRLAPKSLLLNDATLTWFGDTLPDEVDVYVAPANVITMATGFDMHRGCLAVAARPREISVGASLAIGTLVVVLERVVDADNVGSVFRGAEAFGVDAVLLTAGCGDPFYRKAIRTSAGAALVVPFATGLACPDTLDQLRARGFVIAALTPSNSAVNIGEFVATEAATGPLAVLLGSEGHGLSADALERADVQLQIPMSGALDSLNIATAAGIALHRLHDVRRSARVKFLRT